MMPCPAPNLPLSGGLLTKFDPWIYHIMVQIRPAKAILQSAGMAAMERYEETRDLS